MLSTGCFFFSSCYYISVMGEKHEALAVSEKTEETQMVLQVDTFPSSFWTVSSHLAGVRVTAACMR